MSLRFIIGPAGTGKTRLCLSEIREKSKADPLGPPLILLVPASASLEMEKTLLDEGFKGTMRAEVASFRRLASRFLTDRGMMKPPLTDTARRLVLKILLEERREKLEAFALSSERAGFVDSLASFFGEMKVQMLGDEDLYAAAANLPGRYKLLRDKLEDVALLYACYEEFIRGRFTDPADYLTIFASALEGSGTMAGAEVWVDGFAGFTAQETAALTAMMRTASRVSITLCMEDDSLKGVARKEDLFYRASCTYHELKDRALKAGVEVEEPVVLERGGGGRFVSNPALAHLERELTRRPRKAGDYERPLKLVAAQNRLAEVEAAAREMTALARDQGLRWRDMAVLVRDISLYGDLIRLVLAGYDIPCFIDGAWPAARHPLTTLVESALAAALDNFRSEDVLRYLKSGLGPLSYEETCELENYVRDYGITGDLWTAEEDWTFAGRPLSRGSRGDERDLERINGLRRRGTEELKRFAGKIASGPQTARAMGAALFDLLDELEVPAFLAEWAEAAEERGEPHKAYEHARIYGQVLGVLEELADMLGEKEITPSAYREALCSGLSGLKLRMAPPALDQVYVGSVERYFNQEARAVFLLGMNEGVFPAPACDSGLFTDDERERLKEAGLLLADTQKQRLFGEQYLVYYALTRARERLWVSYSLADENGESLFPSMIIGDLRSIFPRLAEEVVALAPKGGADDLEWVAHPGRTASCLAAGLKRMREGGMSVWPDVYNWYLKREGKEAGRLLEPLLWENREQISRPAAFALYSGRRLGATAVERFFACPFAFFLQYGLRADERERAEVTGADRGLLLHEGMRRLVGRMAAALKNGGRIDGEDLAGMVDEIAGELFIGDLPPGWRRSRGLYDKLKRTLLASGQAVLAYFEQGIFRPLLLETGFGPGERLPGIVIRAENGGSMVVSGRIDRLDAAFLEGRHYLTVIDYKTGKAAFRLDNIYHGLSLQLPLYLYAALKGADNLGLKGGEVKPGGMFYFYLHSPWVQGKKRHGAGEAQKERKRSFRMKGLVLANKDLLVLMDQECAAGYSDIIPAGCRKDGTLRQSPALTDPERFGLLFSFLEHRLTEAGEKILAGEADISPFSKEGKTACSTCSFFPVCGFDQLAGNAYRVLPVIKDRDAWAAMAGVV